MFEQLFDNFRKTTEATVQVQQEMFKNWAWLGQVVPPPTPYFGDAQKYQKKCGEVVGEQIKKQCMLAEAQFSAGLQYMDEVFHLAEAKNAEDLYAKTAKLYQLAFAWQRVTCETLLRDFQAAVAKWTELVTMPTAAFAGASGELR